MCTGSRQLFVGPASCLTGRTDERAILRPRHVARVRPREVRIRALGVGQPLQRAGIDKSLTEAFVLLVRAVAPMTTWGRVSSAISRTHARSRRCVVWIPAGLGWRVATWPGPSRRASLTKSFSGVLAWSNMSATAGKALETARAGCGVIRLSGPRCGIELSDWSVLRRLASSSPAPAHGLSADRRRCVIGPRAKQPRFGQARRHDGIGPPAKFDRERLYGCRSKDAERGVDPRSTSAVRAATRALNRAIDTAIAGRPTHASGATFVPADLGGTGGSRCIGDSVQSASLTPAFAGPPPVGRSRTQTWDLFLIRKTWCPLQSSQLAP